MLTTPLRPMRRKQKSFGDHEKFLARVTKTLHYGKYPMSDCTSLPVTELAAEIFSRAKNKLSLDFLDVEEAARLSRNASVSPCSLVLALLYLDRLKSSNPKYLAKVPTSQLFLISLMVGSKFMQDDGQDDEVNNCEWATYAGLTVQDINRAEKEFLDAIQWELFVSKEAFWRRLEAMEKLIGMRQGCKRGWFSYTELDLLLQSTHLAALLKTLLNISLVCMASYTASVFALVGSTMLVSQIPGLTELGAARVPVEPPTTLPPAPALPLDEPTAPDCQWDRLALTHMPWNRTEDCQQVNTRLDSDSLEHATPLWVGVTLDLGALWAPYEQSEPVTSWAYALQRYLLHDSISTNFIPVSRF